MNIDKMRRHNQTRQRDPFRGWREVGWLDLGSGVTFHSFDETHIFESKPLDVWLQATLGQRWDDALRIARHNLELWSALTGGTRVYPAGDGDTIVRGTD